MIDAVTYGMIPSAKIEKRESAEPENVFRRPNTPWPRPPVFGWLARHVAEKELRRVFNLGIGWCAIVAEPAPSELVIGRIM